MVVLKPVGGVGAGRLASRRRSSVFHAIDSDSEDEEKTVKVLFQVNYYTRDCMTVYTVGSSAALGSWKLDQALRMERIVAFDGSWRGEWQLEVELDNVEDLEYKYVCIDDNSKKHVWESDTCRKLNIQGNEREVTVRDKLETPLRSETKKCLAKLSRFPVAPSPMRAMDLGDENTGSVREGKKMQAKVSRPQVAPSPMRAMDFEEESVGSISETENRQGRINELESALQAARSIARGRERELASFRARSMLTPSSGADALPNQVRIRLKPSVKRPPVCNISLLRSAI